MIILKNNLKPTTKDTIHTLNESYIKSVMVTGDNILTGINVSIHSNIIPTTCNKIYIGEYNDHEIV
jgi:cation-transporting ATPase 13A3/4/5